jgi:hypothetical protein
LGSPHFNRFGPCRRVTSAPNGHILTNAQVWSADGQWIYFDIRSDRHGSIFDGRDIRRVHWKSGSVETIYQAPGDSRCGVVLTHPLEDKVIFIHGPEYPNKAWSYGMTRRCGMLLDVRTKTTELLDARDQVEPFTVGALRGGTHVHQFSPQGDWISFTYEDEYLDSLARQNKTAEKNQRNIGIAVPGHCVSVKPRHPRNQSARHYSLICTKTSDEPEPGSDQIQRAYEESWLGNEGYRKPDGSQQKRAMIFLGDVILEDRRKSTELFVIDLPEDIVTRDRAARENVSSSGRRLNPCPEVVQRRLTFLTEGAYPGLQGTRFWPRSTPSGEFVFVLKKDQQGIVQFWRVRTSDGQAEKWTKNRGDISSSFTVSPDGLWLAHTMDRSVCVTSCLDGRTISLTQAFADQEMPLPEAVVWNPAGTAITFICPQASAESTYNQIFVLEVDRASLDLV